MLATHTCVLWRDPPGRTWLRSPKRVEEFETALDLDDPRSLQAALECGAYRDRGEGAPLVLYDLRVYEPGSDEPVVRYRHNLWPGDEDPQWPDDSYMDEGGE